MKKPRKTPPAAPVAPQSAQLQPAVSFPWRRHLLILVGLWAAALLVYSGSFQAGLTFDNGVVIGQDPRIRAATAENLQQIFHEEYWYPSRSVGNYRPLTTLSFLFNYAFLGNATAPAGYHALNFVLQAFNIALVYFLGLLLLEETSWAWLLAALWTLHPLLTESVTNIVGRADQMAALGILAGLLCYIRSTTADGTRKWLWLAGLLLSSTIAVFSKESGVSLVAVMICYDLTFGRSSSWASRLSGYAAAIIPFAAFLFLRSDMLGHGALAVTRFVDNPLIKAPALAAFLTAIKVIGKYLLLYIWPQRLSADYSYNQIPVAVDLGGILSLVICLAALVVAWRARQSGRNLPAFAILAFFAALAPTTNILLRIGSIMAERWIYLPSLSLAILIVLGLEAIHQRMPNIPRRTLQAAALALCLAWSARTWFRNLDWRDDMTLWQSAADAAPGSYKPGTALANLLATSAHPSIDRAIREAERSIAVLNSVPDDDNLALPFAVAGMCYRLKGDASSNPAENRSWYQKALDALLRASRIDLAAREQVNRVNRQAGRGEFQGGLALLYLELGRVHRRLGHSQQAIESLAYGLQLSPLPDFAEEKSQVFRDQGNDDQAAVALLEGMILDPKSKRLATRVVQLYKQTSPGTCAVVMTNGNASFNQQCPLVHGHICEAAHNVELSYRQFGKLDQAAATGRFAAAAGCSANR